MTADLTPAQAARLEAIEAALDEHALGAFSGSESACVCDRQWRPNREYRRHVALAVAAIDVMRGAADDGAVGRVREAEILDAAARSLAINHRRFTEAADILRYYATEHRAGADRLTRYAARAAVGAPTTAEGHDRG